MGTHDDDDDGEDDGDDDGDDDDEDKCFPTLVARGQAAGWEPMEGWPGQWGHWPKLLYYWHLLPSVLLAIVTGLYWPV